MISMPRRPVFLVTHEFFPKRGGIATFTEEIARASADLGYDVELWAQQAGELPEKPWPFRIRRLPLKGTQDLACQFKLAREIIAQRRRLRRATLYLPEPGPMLTMMLLQFFRAFRPHRLILTFHGSEILRFFELPGRRQLTARLIERADRISTLTHYTHRLLCSHFPSAATKTFLTPGAIRTDFSASGRNGRRPDDKVIVLTVGRLHPRKGQLFILEAIKQLPPHLLGRMEYWMVGGGSKENYEDRLRAYAAEANLPVRFFGDVSDEELNRIYAQADIFAMTSINHRTSVEGFGLVYLEAAAHGLPVIAHRVGGVPEAVVQDHTGILVPPGDLVALTAAFERLILHPELRSRFGENGREWAGKNSWKRSADLLFNNIDLTISG